MSSPKNLSTTFKNGIVVPSLIFIHSVTFLSSFFPELAATLLGRVQNRIFINLNCCMTGR
jgi:choline/glycine/proline betaine transport protein